MTRNTLKSTTAILAVISLLQPGPALAQSNVNANADAAGGEITAEAKTEAAKEAKAQAKADAATEAQAGADTEVKDQQTEPAVSGASLIETLTGDPLEALATEVDAGTPADVTTETVTEQTSRSSDEEFKEWSPQDQDAVTTQQSAAPQAKSKKGMSDLEKAGLLALGAAVVGAVLLNGERVQANTGDRVIVVDDDNDYRILKDDDALLRQPGSDVRTQRFSDGSTRTNVMRSDGTEIVTIRDSGGRVLRRVLIETDGREYVLFDDTQSFAPVVVREGPVQVLGIQHEQRARCETHIDQAVLRSDDGQIICIDVRRGGVAAWDRHSIPDRRRGD